MKTKSKSLAMKRLRKSLSEIQKLKKMERGSPQFKKWKRYTQVAIIRASDKNSQHAKDFKNISFSGCVWVNYGADIGFRSGYVAGLAEAGNILESMIQEIHEHWEDDPSESPSAISRDDGAATATRDVFIIHGRDNEAKQTVARFIQNQKLNPIILHEQANQGKTIIEKLEEYAQVGFAIALFTPDDVGGLRKQEDSLRPRARQNVIFEFGYFTGRLGRERVCALVKGDVDRPSDHDGIVYIRMDDQGGWKLKLIWELKSAGFPVDANLAR